MMDLAVGSTQKRIYRRQSCDLENTLLAVQKHLRHILAVQQRLRLQAFLDCFTGVLHSLRRSAHRQACRRIIIIIIA